MNFRKFLGILLWGLCGSLSLGGQVLPEPMSPPRLVNDFAGILTTAQQNELEHKLIDFDRQTSTQIAVVTLSDLQGYEPADYAQRLHDKWGVGRAGKNNGILVLVKPKTPDSRGEVFISVGYGLEGVVPDITAGRIIDTEMLPAFREGDYYQGIDRAVHVLMGLTAGEFSAEEYNDHSLPRGMFSGFLLFGIFVLWILLFRSRRGGGNGSGHNGSSGGGGWIPPVIIGRGFGGFGGFGGGGGFGGFGGGSSGGGGGGRSW